MLHQDKSAPPRHMDLLCRHEFDHNDLNLLLEAAEHGDVEVLEHAACCAQKARFFVCIAWQ